MLILFLTSLNHHFHLNVSHLNPFPSPIVSSHFMTPITSIIPFIIAIASIALIIIVSIILVIIVSIILAIIVSIILIVI